MAEEHPWPLQSSTDRLDQGSSGDLVALQDEANEIVQLLQGLMQHRPGIAEHGKVLAAALLTDISGESSAFEKECRLERFSREVRALWLRSVAAETASVLRTPTEREAVKLATRHDSFGYERDLQPHEQETRCNSFFEQPPPPWHSEHILFSSGQAALVSMLLSFKSPRPLRVQHLGGYFETRLFIQSSPSLCIPVEADADVVIAEPIAFGGDFRYHGCGEIAAAVENSKALILDTTLLGRQDQVADMLTSLDHDVLVLRCVSGLKLLQGGLELANMGIVGAHSRSRKALAEFAGSLREMRTLCGTGLRFTDVLALDAPFVFDPAYADRYAAAVFVHNETLARAVATRNRLFIPPLIAIPSPYCVFSMHDRQDDHAYESLANRIADLAYERKIAFEQGGSFGFRGHRYEIVRPDSQPPFLRVAMGRRGGWSCQGVIDLMTEIAQLRTL